LNSGVPDRIIVQARGTARSALSGKDSVMIPRQLDRLADEQRTELVRAVAAARAPVPIGSDRRLRHRAGWTLVAIGLRIAASAGR
jgi:hypothetical protein